MTTTTETITDVIGARIDGIAQIVGHTEMDEPTMVDVAGELRAAARRITDMARMIESEIPDTTPIVGRNWQTKQSRAASRSFNQSAILAALSTGYETRSIGDTIHHAVNDGAAKLVWSWSGIRKTFDRLNVALTIVPHEISDGDVEPDDVRPHVGEVWETKTGLEPVTK